MASGGVGGKVALANPYEVLKEEDALQRKLEKQAERERRHRQRQEEKAAAAAAAAAAEAAATAAAAAAIRAQLSPGAKSLLQGARWADVDVDSEDEQGPHVPVNARRAAPGTGAATAAGRRQQPQRDAFYTDVETSSDEDLESEAGDDPHGNDPTASSSSEEEEDARTGNREQQARSSPCEGKKKTKGERRGLVMLAGVYVSFLISLRL